MPMFSLNKIITNRLKEIKCRLGRVGVFFFLFDIFKTGSHNKILSNPFASSS